MKDRPTFPTDRKILSRDAARDKIAGLHKQGKVVVFANGCFDVLHVGHIRFLEGAKVLGDVLVVGINSDASMRRIKGEDRPLQDEGQRLSLVAALRAVDFVVLFEEDTADAILAELLPDIHAKGTDYTRETVPERQTAQQHGIRTAIVGDPKNHSTAGMIQEVRRRKGP